MNAVSRTPLERTAVQQILALVPPLLAFVVQWWLWELTSPHVWYLFYPAVVASSWLGGLRAGVVASILSTALVWWFFVEPTGALAKEPRQLFPAAVFLATGCFVAAFHERSRKTNERLTKALHERQIFAALIDNSSDFIGIADADGIPRYVNPAGRRMVGLGADEPVEATKIPDYYPEEQRAFVTDVIVKAMIERGHWQGETYFRHFRTNEAIPVSDEHFMIRDAGTESVLGMGTITRDISGLKRAREENEQALREKEILLREIHHRVKNNLQVMSSLFSLQKSRTDNEEIKSLLDESRTRLQSIALVHDLLYRSTDLAAIDFDEYLHRLVPSIRSSFGAALVDITASAEGVELDVDEAVPCALLVCELLSNSIKHAFGGGPGSVRVQARVDEQGQCVLEVSDDGRGLPRDLDWTKARTLGLRLVRGLTHQLGGTIDLDSSHGARFTLRFAAQRARKQGSPRSEWAEHSHV